MKIILLFICILLTSVDVNAATYIVTEKWAISAEREDGSPLPLSEIEKHTMYRVNCDTGKRTGEIIKPTIHANLTVMYWVSPTPIDCFVMTTTDTDGRTSNDSEVFYAVPYNAPKPVECVP